jgi:cell division protein FtsZ
MPDFVLDHEPAGFARIKVIGVGGGGCNAVDSMYDIGLQNVEFYVINSDLQALKRCKCPNRIQIGAELTKGRGCGASPEMGAKCMTDAKAEITEVLQGADIVFITAGLGGGTGTGGAPVVAQIAKEMGILTVTVVTRPFKFEGPRRMRSAEEGLEKIRAASDTAIVINNERLLDVVGPKVPIKEAFQVADRVLAQAVSSISDLVATPGLVNVDFNDIVTIMRGRGGAVMGVGVGKGENRAHEAVKKATNSPLLDKIVIDGATSVLICITGGPDLTLSEVSEASQLVHSSVDADAEIIFGAVIDETLTDTIRVTIIATGFKEDVIRQQASEPARAEQPQRRQTVETVSKPEPAPTRIVAAAPAAPAPAPAAPAPEPVTTNGFFEAMESAPAPAVVRPAAAPATVKPAGSSNLRDTLRELMNRQQTTGQATESEPVVRNTVRVATSTPAQPQVRPAEPRKVEAAAPRHVEEPAPAVSIFDPTELSDTKVDTDTPAFLRRRKQLFD